MNSSSEELAHFSEGLLVDIKFDSGYTDPRIADNDLHHAVAEQFVAVMMRVSVRDALDADRKHRKLRHFGINTGCLG